MTKLISNIITLVIVALLSACNAGKVKPIQSISDAYLGNMFVQDVTVSYDEELEDRLKRDLDRQTRRLKERKEYLERVNGRRIVSSKTKAEAAEDLEKQQKIYDSSYDNYHNLSNLTRNAVIQKFKSNQNLNKKVNLEVSLKKFKLVSDGMVFMGGGSDSMEGEVTIKDVNDQSVVGVLNVKMQEVNLSGGMVGAMSRTANPKENLIEIFSQEVLKAINDED